MNTKNTATRVVSSFRVSKDERAEVVALIRAIAAIALSKTQLHRLFSQLIAIVNQNFSCNDFRYAIEDQEDAKQLMLMAICGGDRRIGINTRFLTRLINKWHSDEQLYTMFVRRIKRVYHNKLMDILKKNHPHLSLDFDENFINLITDEKQEAIRRQKQECDRLVAYIKDDKKGQFKGCHIRKKAHCNAQFLIIKRLIDQLAWDEIAAQLNVTPQTINGRFYQQRCLNLLREIVEEEFEFL
jgi:hypothetical protein